MQEDENTWEDPIHLDFDQDRETTLDDYMRREIDSVQTLINYN